MMRKLGLFAVLSLAVCQSGIPWPTEAEVKVLSRDAALFQGHYSCTTTRNDGRVLYWPGNASWTNLLERTADGWKITMGANAADEEGREYTGTACDGVLTIEGPDGIGIMHKRG